jgi:hypothetical protein
VIFLNFVSVSKKNLSFFKHAASRATLSVIASDSSATSHTFQSIALVENSFTLRAPLLPPNASNATHTNVANEFHGGATRDHLLQSGGTLTEMQLLNGEIVHLRQRLQMEVLANQELEEVGPQVLKNNPIISL